METMKIKYCVGTVELKKGQVYRDEEETEWLVLFKTYGVKNDDTDFILMNIKTLTVDGSSFEHWYNKILSGDMKLIGEVIVD